MFLSQRSRDNVSSDQGWGPGWLQRFAPVVVMWWIMSEVQPRHCCSSREWEWELGFGNRQWEWDGNSSRLNRGMGMGMNSWEWEGLGTKMSVPLTSTLNMPLIRNRDALLWLSKLTTGSNFAVLYGTAGDLCRSSTFGINRSINAHNTRIILI